MYVFTPQTGTRMAPPRASGRACASMGSVTNALAYARIGIRSLRGGVRCGTAMRLSPAQVWSDRSVDAPLLINRDGTTKVQVVGTTHVFVRFAKPLVHPKVKVLGAKALRVSATGMGASSPLTRRGG